MLDFVAPGCISARSVFSTVKQVTIPTSAQVAVTLGLACQGQFVRAGCLEN
jgi:hypothetical protein